MAFRFQVSFRLFFFVGINNNRSLTIFQGQIFSTRVARSSSFFISISHTHTHAYAHTRTHIHTHYLSLSLTYTHTHIYTLSLTNIHTHTHTDTHTHTSKRCCGSWRGVMEKIFTTLRYSPTFSDSETTEKM